MNKSGYEDYFCDVVYSQIGRQLWDRRAWSASIMFPVLVAQYRPLPKRRFVFDFAIPSKLIAFEIDGGVWMKNGGRHNTDADRDRNNLLAAHFWRIFRFSTTKITDDPIGVATFIVDDVFQNTFIRV